MREQFLTIEKIKCEYKEIENLKKGDIFFGWNIKERYIVLENHFGYKRVYRIKVNQTFNMSNESYQYVPISYQIIKTKVIGSQK